MVSASPHHATSLGVDWRSPRQVEEVASYLSSPTLLGPKVGRYHGQMSMAERRASHTNFMRDDVEVMVATLAYGMGIDKAK